MKIGDKITFQKYIKHNNASVYPADDNIELPYKLIRVDEITLSDPMIGIICGKRNMVKSSTFNYRSYYADGFEKHDELIAVYLVASRLDGFYRVPCEWVEEFENSDSTESA